MSNRLILLAGTIGLLAACSDFTGPSSSVVQRPNIPTTATPGSPAKPQIPGHPVALPK